MLAGDFVRAAPFETVRTKDIELHIVRFENDGPFHPNVPIIPAVRIGLVQGDDIDRFDTDLRFRARFLGQKRD